MGTTFSKTLSLMAYENNLTKDITDDYYLRAKTEKKSLGTKEIAEEVAARQGKYEAGEIEMLMNVMMEVMADAVSSGYIVSTPLCMIQPTATGVVMKADLSKAPDPKVVKVYASCTQGALLRQAMGRTKLEIFTQPAVVGPLLNGAVSTRTEADGTTRARLEAGEMCMLTGRNLKLAGTNPAVGITLTSVADPEKTVHISMDRVSPNEPKRLQFVIPAEVTEGLWRVTVTTQQGSGSSTILKEPRSFELETPLRIGTDGSGDGDIVDDPTA